MPSAVDEPRRPLPDSALPSNPPDLSKKLPRLTPRQRAKPNAAPSEPAPETPPLPRPPSQDELSFQHPRRRILSEHDQELFLASPTYTLVVSFIFSIADSVTDVPVSAVANEPLHPTVSAVVSILDAAEHVHEDCPADYNGGSRFGNPAFRTFLSSLAAKVDVWHGGSDGAPPDQAQQQPPQQQQHLAIRSAAARDELNTYLLSSFGSGSRIDYGSGHELHFFMYLLSLYQLGHLPAPAALPQLALVLLPRYLALMRRLQAAYYLEPAGSHGVWGLDDYHFLPFLFGAAQLRSSRAVRPLAIHSDAALEAYAPEYLYLDMVAHVNATKTVRGLRWHSPMLDDISGVREGWGKIYGGMKKMFLKEVLGKLVVMQHFLFGGLVPAAAGMGAERGEGDVGAEGSADAREDVLQSGDAHEGHVHGADAWGDCCGIRVPSSVGAAEEMRKRTGGRGLRRVPFD